MLRFCRCRSTRWHKTKASSTVKQTQRRASDMMLAILSRIGLVLSLSALVTASRCPAPVNLQTSLNSADSVFRGRVLRELVDANDNLNYVVSVTRVFRGCNFNATERILVTVGSIYSQCTVPLVVNATYAFAGRHSKISNAVKEQLGPTTRVRKSVTIGSGDQRWSQVSPVDLKKLRAYDNTQCKAICETGLDCPSTHYCDLKVCVPTDAACPVSLSTCDVSPCSLAGPCPSATTPYKCQNNLCGGCNAILLDATNTRVCGILS